MTRRIVWYLLLAAVLAVLGAIVYSKFEQVTVERWTPPGPEARRNELLAFERFMTAMGRPLTRTQSGAPLDKLPAGGALILDNRHTAQLTPARATALLTWVEQGGYLIVTPEPPGVKDPLLAHFDVTCNCSNKSSPQEPKTDGPVKKAPLPKSITVTIPGTSRPLQIDFINSWLRLGQTEPAWQAAAPDHLSQIMHFDHGKGHVTIIASLDSLLNNHNIGDLDHAELLWTLLETYQPDHSRPVALMTRAATPSLWEWLAESAWTALIAGAALIGLWLWTVVPRFGAVRPEPEAARRELTEHLAAVGRYVWRAGGLESWLDTARASLKSRLALRHPAILEMPPAEQVAALAKLTQAPPGLIAAALHQNAGSPHSFTQAMRTLRMLENLL